MRIVLVPGAGGGAWFWSRVEPLLAAAGHDPVAVDLPADDPAAGLPEYADLIVEAAGTEPVLLVAQSMGGFSAALAADRLVAAGRPPAGLVLLNAMIPLPGETAGEWWDAVGQGEAMAAAAEEGGWSSDFDLDTYFLHDIDPAVFATLAEPRDEHEIAFAAPCAIDTWPAVPTTVLVGADDRFFPLAFQRRVSRDRLGLEPIVIPGGHLAALSRPEAVADAVLNGVR